MNLKSSYILLKGDILTASRSFKENTDAVDSIPLKLVFYITMTGIVLVLMATAWYNITPSLEDVSVDEQLTEAALSISSIQQGYSRDITDTQRNGSICIIPLSLPQNIRYVAFGVDPDPDVDGNLSNCGWVVENNTILCGYDNGIRKKVFINGDDISFKKGMYQDDHWTIYKGPFNCSNEDKGVVIRGPVEMDIVFELVFDGRTHTLSHF